MVHTRATLHQLVNEELKGRSDALNDLDKRPSKTPDIKTQGANPSEDQSKDNPEEYINHTKDLDIGQAAAEAGENPPTIADNASREPGTRTEEESDKTTVIETDTSILSNHEAKYTLESAMELPGASQLLVLEEHDAKLSEKTNEFLEEADTKTAEESVTGHPDNVDIRPLERPDATASPEIQTMHAEETDTKPLEKSGATPAGQSKMMPQENPNAKANRESDGTAKEPDQTEKDHLQTKPSADADGNTSVEGDVTSLQ